MSHNNYNEINPTLNNDSILSWTVSNSLSINVEKTEMVIASSKNTTHSNNKYLYSSCGRLGWGYGGHF